MIVEVVIDGADQRGDIVEAAAANAFVGKLAEPALDEIQPGARGRDEVQVEARMAPQPGPDPRVLVGSVVVDDEVQVELGGSLAVDLL